MPAPKIDEPELLDRLIGVFRARGYEGASLSRLAEATGLQRASLYHRFPGGKQQMADAVLGEIERRYAVILEPLEEAGEPRVRVQRMAERLGGFHGGGQLGCVLDTLSLTDAAPALRERLTAMLAAWRNAMASVAREAGATPAAARKRAEDAIAQVEGALVVARVTGETSTFRRALAALPDQLLG